MRELRQKAQKNVKITTESPDGHSVDLLLNFLLNSEAAPATVLDEHLDNTLQSSFCSLATARGVMLAPAGTLTCQGARNARAAHLLRRCCFPFAARAPRIAIAFLVTAIFVPYNRFR